MCIPIKHVAASQLPPRGQGNRLLAVIFGISSSAPPSGAQAGELQSMEEAGLCSEVTLLPARAEEAAGGFPVLSCSFWGQGCLG